MRPNYDAEFPPPETLRPQEETRARLIAFYLPQFHPIPENDAWWGKGFTEWANVAKAKPSFKGHYQPHLPADLGFYDLRLSETREAQATLARAHGIHGFCYYHYWFGGRRVLERPFNDVLASGKPDFPFCLCWANENWTRRWDGAEAEILLAQRYSEDDDREHMRWLAAAFRDPRYIRVSGKPMFLVYRASALPNPQRTVEIWRDEALRLGVGEIHLCAVESFLSDHGVSHRSGFDAAVEFAPDWSVLPRALRSSIPWRVARKLKLANRSFRENYIASYSDLIERMMSKPSVDYLRFPCVTPSWDNTARRKAGARMFVGSTPELYGQWLQEMLQRLSQSPREEQIVFINGWNEWAEGNHLEPCQKWGHAYLEATHEALRKTCGVYMPAPTPAHELIGNK